MSDLEPTVQEDASTYNLTGRSSVPACAPKGYIAAFMCIIIGNKQWPFRTQSMQNIILSYLLPQKKPHDFSEDSLHSISLKAFSHSLYHCLT